MAAKAPPVSDPDLVWLLNESEGALGLRSSYGPLVDLALSGVTSGAGSGGPRWLSQGRVLAAGAERELRGRLERVEPRLRAVLWLAYGPQPWPSEVRRVSIFGHWPGVLLLSETARQMFQRAVERRAEREEERRAEKTSRGEGGRVEALAICVIDEEGDAPTDIEVPRLPGAMVVRQGPRRTSGKLYEAVLDAPPRDIEPEHSASRIMALSGLTVAHEVTSVSQLVRLDGDALAEGEVVRLHARGGVWVPPTLWRWRPQSTSPLGAHVLGHDGRRGRWHQVRGPEAAEVGPPRDTTLDPVAAMLRRGLGEWLRSPTTSGDKALMAKLRAEARALVAEAHAAWRATSAFAPREPEPKKRRERVQVEEAI